MSKKRVLVVEDNMDSYELMRFVLERNGYETFLAVNGLDGVSAAQKQVPDLIIMDLSMPIMDGWTATSLIKKDEHISNIPVIAVTAYAMPGDRMRALNVGCDEYVTKPMDLLDLVETVNLWVNKGKVM
ncbi:MAG: response regulator [Anaerolineales bacterium]|nr:response regulator [Anaerolineales bacterium]